MCSTNIKLQRCSADNRLQSWSVNNRYREYRVSVEPEAKIHVTDL